MEFHPKTAIFVGCGAFLLSIILGLANGAPFFLCLARAVFFAVIFFVITTAIFNIIKGNFMEAQNEPAAARTGENIDISLGGNVPDFEDNNSAGNIAGNIDDIVFDKSDNINQSTQYESNTQYEPSTPGVSSDSSAYNTTNAEQAVQGAETGEQKDKPKGGLEQNENSGYNAKSSTVSSAGKTGDDGLSFDGSDFIAGMPGINDNPEDKTFKKSQNSVKESIVGDFEMTVRKRPERNIDLSELGPDVNSKKVADAIHTLLVKDKEG